MELAIVEGLRTLKFDLVLTLALAAVFLFIGYGLQRRVGFLSWSSIPAPAIGGLLFATIVLLLRARGVVGISLDTSLRSLLQTAFFTTIGLGATLRLLRSGGWRTGLFWLIASGTAIVQNIIGIGVASMIGAPLALGVICGSLTLTGGPATGLAFSDAFEGLGIGGASALIIASATFGIFVSSLVGNPVARVLIRRFRLASQQSDRKEDDADNLITQITDEINEVGPADVKTGMVQSGPTTGYTLLRSLAIILIVMGLGSLFSLILTKTGVTLPGYIGAMVIAAVARNLDDRFDWLKIDVRVIESLGTVALALFLVIALMDLKLWQLAGLAIPMLIILAVQIVVTILYALLTTFMLMGRDYEAVVMTSGHIGFGLGITPNAVANMEALTARFGPAPQSFLIVPMVGAFFIDFSNSLIITFFINIVK